MSNALSSTPSFAAAFAKESGLGPTERLILEILNKTRRDLNECWLATQTLADRVGRSVRAVQLALKRLKDDGYIKVKRTPKLNSGHRIYLLWRGMPNAPADPSVAPDFGAPDCAGETHRIAPASPPPLNRRSEDNKPVEIDGGEPIQPQLPPAPEPAGPPPPPQPDLIAPQPEEPTRRKATPAEVAQAVDKAKAIFGPGPKTTKKVRGFAKRWGLSWVLAALDRAATKAQKGTVVWGYVVRTLEGFAADGGPPDPPPTEEEARARKAAEDEAELALLVKLYGPKEGPDGIEAESDDRRMVPALA